MNSACSLLSFDVLNMSVAQNVSIVTPLFESFSILTTIVRHKKFCEKSTGSEKFGL